MEIAIKAIQLIMSLSILIVLHELGHFLPAKWFNTRVEKFYLFFDVKFSLFKYKKGETEYGIGWLPLGGYVKIAGMIDESLEDNAMDSEPQPWEFRAKPAWQRLIIMVGGVTVNIIFGFMLYMMILFCWGQDYVAAGETHNGFVPSPLLEELGFQKGDKILEINGSVPFDVLDVNQEIMFHGAQNIKVLHPDQSEEVISLPEDIDMQLFKAGERGFEPRMAYTTADTVMENTAASKAGVKSGDVITALNNKEIKFWDEIKSEIQTFEIAEIESIIQNCNNLHELASQYKERAMAISVQRESQTLSMNITPVAGKLGVAPIIEEDDFGKKYIGNVQNKEYGFFESIGAGTSFGMTTLADYVRQFKFVFTPKGATGIGGFGAIGGLFPAEWDWKVFWERTALISIMLAFMNILPIPALDGGHVLFLIFEMISGRAPSEKFLMRAQVFGMVLLLSLLLYANGLDILRLFIDF